MIFPQWSASVAVAPLVTWMAILTAKHVVADFLLQNAWMARGKDAREGWLLPLTVHCLIHGVIATIIFSLLAPQFWFLGLVDFALHFVIDRSKGLCVNYYKVGPDRSGFWWLIGIDQALHHLTDFAWAVAVAAV